MVCRCPYIYIYCSICMVNFLSKMLKRALSSDHGTVCMLGAFENSSVASSVSGSCITILELAILVLSSRSFPPPPSHLALHVFLRVLLKSSTSFGLQISSSTHSAGLPRVLPGTMALYHSHVCLPHVIFSVVTHLGDEALGFDGIAVSNFSIVGECVMSMLRCF